MDNKKRLFLERAIYVFGGLPMLIAIVLIWGVSVVSSIVVSDVISKHSSVRVLSMTASELRAARGDGCPDVFTSDSCEKLRERAQETILSPQFIEHIEAVSDSYDSLNYTPLQWSKERQDHMKSVDSKFLGYIEYLIRSDQRTGRTDSETDEMIASLNSTTSVAQERLFAELRDLTNPTLLSLWFVFFLANVLLNRDYIQRTRVARNTLRCERRKLVDRYNL